MPELTLSELEAVNGGLSEDAGAVAKGLIASAAFAVGMTDVGFIAIASGLACAALIDQPTIFIGMNSVMSFDGTKTALQRRFNHKFVEGEEWYFEFTGGAKTIFR